MTHQTPDAADKRHAELGGDTSVIPSGWYCRGHAPGSTGTETPCPYWAKDPDQHRQTSGYCALLKSGDWMQGGTKLLWDQIKECNHNLATDVAPAA